MKQQNLPEIRLVSTQETESGELIVTCDVTDEFKAWFKRDQGLKRWSPRRFEKFFIEAMENYLKENERHSVSSSNLVDGKPGEVNEEVGANREVR